MLQNSSKSSAYSSWRLLLLIAAVFSAQQHSLLVSAQISNAICATTPTCSPVTTNGRTVFGGGCDITTSCTGTAFGNMCLCRAGFKALNGNAMWRLASVGPWVMVPPGVICNTGKKKRERDGERGQRDREASAPKFNNPAPD